MSESKRPLEESALGQLKEAKRAKKSKSSKLFLDDLAWKEVAMPDRLDDVEGFYGLEEVEGVDVAGTDGGKVEFKLADKTKKTKAKKTRPKIKTAVSTSKAQKESDSGVYDDAEEWAGISDADTVGTLEPGNPNKEHKKPKKDKKDKTVMQAKDKQSTKSQTRNSFESLLEDQPEDSDEDDFDLSKWDELNLSPPTLQALAKLKFLSPTPIQSSAIPEIMAGHDLVGKASTGSGKTLAFGIPILEAFLKSSSSSTELANAAESKKGANKLPMALILSPTRELAHQLCDHLTALAKFAPDLRIVTLTGGLSLQKQQRQMEQGGGADLIIATPGRLWEVVSEGVGWIDKLKRGLKFLVVDEADRLLQEGHYKEVEELLNLLQRVGGESDDEGDHSSSSEEDVGAMEFKNKNRKPKLPAVKRQTLVFSATFHQGLQQKLASKGKKAWAKTSIGGDLMNQAESLTYLLKKLNFREESPKFVDANPAGQLAERLREGIIECGALEKDLYLYYLLLRYPCRTLVFTNSISSVKRLAPFLSELQLPVHLLHSNMIQKARLRNLERFTAASSPNSILIATDVAARGLDIKGIEIVIHYHLPRTADMYVHRSGRTARSDARGISILLCAPEEVMGVRRLVGKVHEQANKSTGRYAMKSFGCDRKLVNRLKKRADLAKKISDSSVEKMKKTKEDDWLKSAAEELGVEYDIEDFNSLRVGKKGQRGKQKREKAANASKADVSVWKAELRELLKEKINSGFSTRYLTSGVVNIAKAMLDGNLTHDNILGAEKKSVMDEVAW